MKKTTTTTTTATTETKAIKSNADIIAAITVSDVTISASPDTRQSITVTTAVKLNSPTELEAKAFADTVKRFAKEAIATAHRKEFNSDVFASIANGHYTCTFGEAKFEHIVPALEVMNPEAKTAYNDACTSLQLHFAEYLNTVTNNAIDPAIKSKVWAIIKTHLQEVSDLFRANSKADLSLYINNRDMEILSASIIRCKSREFTTIGDKAVQNILETMFASKIAGKEYFVKVLTAKKNVKNTVPKFTEVIDEIGNDAPAA